MKVALRVAHRVYVEVRAVFHYTDVGIHVPSFILVNNLEFSTGLLLLLTLEVVSEEGPLEHLVREIEDSAVTKG